MPIPFLLIFLAFFALPSSLEAAPCGKIVIGGLDWGSSNFQEHLAAKILRHGYGCEVEIIPGTSVPMIAALERGDVDFMMEVWRANNEVVWTRLEREGKVVFPGVAFPDAVQGFYVPQYLTDGDPARGIEAAAPDLKSIFDLAKYKDLFRDPEQPEKGRFYNCILGWTCEDVNTRKFYAYGLDKDFVNFKSGTGAALDSVISSGYEQGLPFVAYYWGPTWILGKYKLRLLEEPPYDKKVWEEMLKTKRPKRATAYPVIKVFIGANKKFADSHPLVIGFLKAYGLTSATINEALAFMQEKEGRTPEDAAEYFLRTQDKIWKTWVSEDAARKVVASLELEAAQPKEWSLDVRGVVNHFVGWVVSRYGPTFKAMGKPVLWMILMVERVLLFAPWWLLTLLTGGLALFTMRRWLPAGVILCMVGIKALGLWDLSMQTLALMLISTLISAAIGLPIGILSSRYDRFRAVLLPVLDAMQTMPSFVYLIPALMLFGLGKVPAVFATVIYAIVPTIRLTDLGVRSTDPAIVEAAEAFGASYSQVLFNVRIPLALSTILAGINQTTMMALSMVVIASMIGSRGLGEQVLLGIQKLDVGQGFTAGIAIVLLAIVLDRITQGIGRRFDRNAR